MSQDDLSTHVRIAQGGGMEHQKSKQFGLFKRSLKFVLLRDGIATNPRDILEGYFYRRPGQTSKRALHMIGNSD